MARRRHAPPSDAGFGARVRAQGASAGIATAVTLGAALLVLGTLPPRVLPWPAPERSPDREAEHVIYAVRPAALKRSAPAAHSTAAVPRPVTAARDPGGARTGPGAAALPVPDTGTAGTGGSAASGSAGVSGEEARPAPRTGTAGATGAPSDGAPSDGARVRRPVGAVPRPVDSALVAPPPRLIPPPLTQAERDSLGRAAALALFAASDHGTPRLHAAVAGSVAVPLPGGGPSRRRRQRDRAIDAEVRERLARVQWRADSAIAARRRRAEALTPPADPARDATRPRP